MKKITLCTIKFLFIIFQIKAQNVSTDWVNSPGGSQTGSGFSVTIDNSGYVYTTGDFSGTMDFDPGIGVFNLISNGLTDIFLTKMDSQGNFIWALSIGGTAYDNAKGITTDVNGNIFITGNISATVDFDPGPGFNYLTSSGFQDMFICKISSSGNLVWAKSIGSSASDFSYSIAVDLSNNIYTTGIYGGTVDFDPGVGVFNLPSSYDAFILKLDNNGNFIWAKAIGGTTETQSKSIIIDNNAFIYTTGYFRGTADFDPSNGLSNISSYGNTNDVFVLKLDLSGNFIWVKTIGGSADDIGNSIDSDSLGNIYFTGSYQSTADFDPNGGLFNITTNGVEDIFISKLDQSGNFVWAQSIGGIDFDRGYSIDVVGNNIYLGGIYEDSVDFDPGAAIGNLTTHSIGAFIANYDFFGNLNWAKSFGNENGIGICTLNSLKCDNFGNIFSTGNFGYTIDFNPNIGILNITASSPSKDIFIHKLKPCLDTYFNSVVTACQSYSIGIETYSTSGNYFQTIPNADGCDSLITLDLTINNPSSIYIIDTACYEYTLNNQTYSNSGIYTQILNNSFGCDSTILIDLTIYNLDISTSFSGVTISANAIGASYQWLNCNAGISIITGETNQMYTPTANGDYAVIISLNGCLDTSVCVNVSNLGLVDFENANEDITIITNPTLTFQKLQVLSQSNIEDIIIYNLLGGIIYNLKPNEKYVDIEFEVSGVYFLSITTQRGHSTKKIIIQK